MTAGADRAPAAGADRALAPEHAPAPDRGTAPVPGPAPAPAPEPVTTPAPAPEPAPEPVADRWRLRPGVAVTPLRDGLHLRGRRGSITLEGSPALPALWRLLQEPLRTGEWTGPVSQAAPGTPLRTALDTLLGHLHAHDLLVAADPGPGPAWIAATADHPAEATAVLAATPVTVLTGAAAGPLADAAARALRAAGATVSRAGSRDLPAGAVLLRTGAAGRRLAVAAGESRDGGYVTAPGGPAQAGADAAALAARLGAGPPAAPAPATTALLAGAAAQRLLCAAGGLPDPAGEGDDPRLLPGLPAVLVATARPPRADYRSWLGPDRLDADRRARLGPAGGLATALARTAALTDERTGALPAPAPGTLCQLPVPLAACPLPGTTVLAGAPRTDLARLDAFCRACEVRLGPGAVVGASPGHARGRALRRAAARYAARRRAGSPLPAADWDGHPQARHWWTTLTVRLGVPARLEVFRAGEEGVYLATVHHAPLPSPAAPEAVRGPAAAPVTTHAVTTRPVEAVPGHRAAGAPAPHREAEHAPVPADGVAAVPGHGATGAPVPGEEAWRVRPAPVTAHGTADLPVPVYAVEATPGDAVAWAALSAVAAVSAAAQGAGEQPPAPAGGAAAPLAAADGRRAPWEDDGWTDGWLAGTAGREPALQDALRRLTGGLPAEAAPGATRDVELAALLRAFGFTVLVTEEDR